MKASFPVHVFDDIDGSDFAKHNKKNVTEDFVTENFKAIGWRVYRPFNDSGIDLIATKNVCPNNHTAWDDSINGSCNICKSAPIEITRYIQIKTREIKEQSQENTSFFGYTLKSKDFRTDPRHVFLLYSDNTNDFIIFPIFDYLEIFSNNIEMGKGHFGTPSFRVGNNKINSLKYYSSNNNWGFVSRNSKVIFIENYVNEAGIKNLSNPKYDINIDSYIDKLAKLKIKLFYNYSRGRQCEKKLETKIRNILSLNLTDNINNISQYRKRQRIKLRNELSEDLVKSIEEGYFVKFKGLSFYE